MAYEMRVEGIGYREKAIATAISVAAFFAYAAFPFLSPPFQNSPDEAANLFFAKTYVQMGKLEYREPLNAVLEERIVPRSMRAIGERVVPVGFVGVPLLYGLAARVTTPAAIPFMTPFMLALAVAILFFAVRTRADVEVAILAALAFAFHPAVWYYASRGLFPNGPFIGLVVMIFALLWWGESRTGDRPAWTQLLVAFLVGLTVIIRASEIPWLFLGILLFAYLANARRLFSQIGALVIAVAVSSFFLGYLNNLLFGSPLTFGYSKALAVAGPGEFILARFWHFLVRFVRYGLLIFPIPSALAVIGGIALMKRKELREHFFGPALGAGVILLCIVAFYGSIGSSDVLVSGEATIGTSYVRYWLPAFVGSAFLIVIGIRIAAEWIQKKIPKRTTLAALVAVYILSSFWSVWYGSSDSLSKVIASLRRYETVKHDVLAATEPDAIIIADATDKIFFPDRRVVAGLRSDGTYQAIPKILRYAPLYYYGITLPPTDLEFLRTNLLVGAHVEALKTFDYETLYRFSL